MPGTFAMVPLEACADDRLTKIQMRVLIALCSFRNSEHEDVWPSRAKLSIRCGYSEQTISRATTDLCRLGWLQKTGKGGFSKACTYRITPPETVPEPDTVAELETVPEPDLKRCPNPTQNGARTRQGQRTDQEQTIEHTSVRIRAKSSPRFKKPYSVEKNTAGEFIERVTDRSWAD